MNYLEQYEIEQDKQESFEQNMSADYRHLPNL